jgi:hypothetical protein
VAKGGIVKVTVAGKPTMDVVVSVEGVSRETAKAQLSPKIKESHRRPEGYEIHSLRIAGGGRGDGRVPEQRQELA